MTVYEEAHRQYIEAQKNNFFDAWGIVMSPITAHQLRAECMEHIVRHKANIGAVDKIFGLVVIPHKMVSKDTMYIVDEPLGRQILKGAERCVDS